MFRQDGFDYSLLKSIFLRAWLLIGDGGHPGRHATYWIDSTL